MKLLVIEDDPKIRAYIEKGLKEAGHTIDTAEDGEIGLHLAANEKYDVMVIDRMLPKVDGLTIIRRFSDRQGYRGGIRQGCSGHLRMGRGRPRTLRKAFHWWIKESGRAVENRSCTV